MKTQPLWIVVGALLLTLSAAARDRILEMRFVPPKSELFIADGDGTHERKLFETSEIDYSPSISSDGQWLVFTSERNGSADIFRSHLDGSGLERLTDDPAYDDQGTLSPDGSQLAFVSTRGDGTADIWIQNLKTRKARNLTQTAGGDFRPSWSPDGKWLAFSSDRGTTPKRGSVERFEQLQEASVYIIDSGGKGLRRISAAGSYAGSPRWSLDGRQLLFYETTPKQAFDARMRTPIGEMLHPESQIVVVDVASGARRELTSGPGLKVAPQWISGDVKYLIKDGEHAGLASLQRGAVASCECRDIAWAPDGNRIVYRKASVPVPAQNPVQKQVLPNARYPEFDFAASGAFPSFSRTGKLAVTAADGFSLSVMNADGSGAKLIAGGNGVMAYYPSWSPDEQWIAFGLGAFFVGGAKPAQIAIVHPDGSGLRELTSGTVNSGFPSFSADGKQLVYREWSGDKRGLRILTIADGSIRTLTTESDNFPVWSPRGDLIQFTRAIDGAYDIFTIRPDGTGLKRLTNTPGNDAHGVWSPDGAKILFSSARLGFKDESPLYDSNFQPYAELFVMNAGGTGQRPLTDNQWEDGTPAWQPPLTGK